MLNKKNKFLFNKLYRPFINEYLDWLRLSLGPAAVGLEFFWRPLFCFLNGFWTFFEVADLMLEMSVLVFL